MYRMTHCTADRISVSRHAKAMDLVPHFETAKDRFEYIVQRRRSG